MKIKLGAIGILLLTALALSGCTMIADRHFMVEFYGDVQKADKIVEEFIESYECPEGYAVTWRGATTVHCRRVR